MRGEPEEVIREEIGKIAECGIRYGAKYRALLPFLFAESVEKEAQPQIRYDYMDCISKLYAQNFARPIGQWCKEHGVEYIGHVVEDNSVRSRPLISSTRRLNRQECSGK